MRTRFSVHHLAFSMLVMLAVFLGTGCGEDDNPADPGRPRIFIGAARDLGAQTISSGTFVLDRPGDPLDGLTIDVPVGALDGARTFRISSSPIDKHELGEDFNPITPVITIDNGGGYADEPMTLTIPCKVPAGHFAMAFTYDRTTGRMEGIPTVDMTDSSITVATSHFSFSGLESMAKRSWIGGSAVMVGNSDVVVSSIPEAKLEEPSNSGFVPGTDDWQFPNCGSMLYLGHCSGQSATMMWYYAARKQNRGDEQLYGRFDNDGARTTPKIWQDDVDGYRFCGLAQVDLPWMTLSQRLLVQLERTLPNKVTYNLFSYAIRITKQPQFVWIIHEKGTDSGSHAMVIYKTHRGRIFICDPNYPGKDTRETEFSFGQFLPYYTGPNAQWTGAKYTKFFYIAQFSIIDAQMFARRWGEVINGTIASEKYPSFSIAASDGNGPMQNAESGFTTTTGLMEADVRNSDIPLKISKVFDANENEIPFPGGVIKLRYGRHLLGFYVTNMKNDWAGFKWIEVDSKEDATEPTPTPPSESGSDCASWLKIDDVGMLVTGSSYGIYPDGQFRFMAEFPGGSARASTRTFGGVGTYELWPTVNISDGGTFIMYHNGNSWYCSGTMNITRWDAEKVAGNFEFTKKDGAGTVLKKVYGEFQCNR